ncbi:family 43 glycosylhydrolase [Nonomuraea bangladeshensis]|uniref:family 43 glycosylhydrolase n=1 Tax=Nonomuraea bangladeshensis TaxID=404385 RepID=UPI0031E2256C
MTLRALLTVALAASMVAFPASHATAAPRTQAVQTTADELDKLYGSLAGAVAADYTAGSWHTFEPVRRRAADLLTGSPTPEQREAARTELAAAADSLVMTRGLRELVTTYRTRKRADYTRKSWTPLFRALAAAESVLADDQATRATVVQAKNALQNAAAGLVPLSDGRFADIRNDTFWHDTQGNPIYSQGGGIFRFGDTYYWYGVRYVGAELYYKSPTKAYDRDATFVAITSYSSKDLVHWTFENNIATAQTPVWIPPSKDVAPGTFSRMTNLADTSWMGRMGVAYNENTGKYTVLIQMKNALDDQSGNTAQSVLFLQGDSPTDDFTYANIQPQIQNSPTSGTGDQTVFTDDDGSDYLIFSNRAGRTGSYVAKISDADSLSVEPAKLIGYVPAGREGNAMFKHDGHYYVATSALHGWNTSPTYLIKSKTGDIMGDYTPEYVLPGTERDYSHVTQSGFFVNVKGTVIYAGDRWADFAWNGIGYNQWLPLSEAEDGLLFHSLSHWRLNAETGKWRPGTDNNHILNPEFAADRVIVKQLTGWTGTGTITNTSPGAGSTRFAATLGGTEPATSSLSQENALPRGTYRLTLQAKTAGGLDHARVRVTGGRHENYVLDLNQPTEGWQPRELRHLRLTGGQMRISVEAADSTGGRTLSVDAFTLVRER